MASDWQFLEVDGLGAWRRGSGPDTALLLHGGPGLSDYTGDLADVLADELGDGWTIARFQQRGLEPSTTTGPFTVEQHVADVLRVCDALTDEPVTLIGHSWGGHLAMHVAVSAPARVRAAVIVDPLGAVPDGGMAAMARRFGAQLTDEEADARARLAARTNADGPSAEVELADLAIVWKYYFADPADAPPMPPLRMSVDAHLQTFASIHSHFARDTLVRALPSTPTRALFVAGTKSPIPHVESERSAALMPNATVMTAPTGHFPWLEAPTWTLLPAIAAFIAST